MYVSFSRSVAHILDAQPERCCAARRGSSTCREMETLRQPPPKPLADITGGDPTPKTGNTMNGDMIRDVIEKASDDAGCRNLLENFDLFSTRTRWNSLGLGVPLCKECANPRSREDSRLFATLTQSEPIGPVCSIATTDSVEKCDRCLRVWQRRQTNHGVGHGVFGRKFKTHVKSSGRILKAKKRG